MIYCPNNLNGMISNNKYIDRNFLGSSLLVAVAPGFLRTNSNETKNHSELIKMLRKLS